ncbi:MAG: enoyl-CoA hydratase/isomerase family protein [Acidimicrobiia bacterium]
MIRWETRDHVGLATIDRQERRNALNAELCDELGGHLETQQQLRVVVITGAGTAFCSGADLVTRFEGEERQAEDTLRPAFEKLMDAVIDFPGAVIAAVNGPALGAGTQLAVGCDLRVVGPTATFGIPAARLGLVLSPANMQRLALLVGQAAARDLLMTGRTIDRDEASEIGLVHRSVDDALAAALELAYELAELAPLTVAGHKRALNLVARAQGIDGAARDEIRALEEAAVRSRDLQEGLAAFGEKRAPRFEGR